MISCTFVSGRKSGTCINIFARHRIPPPIYHSYYSLAPICSKTIAKPSKHIYNSKRVPTQSQVLLESLGGIFYVNSNLCTEVIFSRQGMCGD